MMQYASLFCLLLLNNRDPQTHGVLLQYLDLLTSPQVISPQDYSHKILPPLSELGETYGISAPICMQIIRPMLNASLLVRYPF